METIVASSPEVRARGPMTRQFCTLAPDRHGIGTAKRACSVHAPQVSADSICIRTSAVQNIMTTFATAPRRRLFDTGIEWEELPSLADSLAKRLAHRGKPSGDFQNSSSFHSVWDATVPAALDPLQESGPFVEPLRGLVTRELREPDVFRHFFA
jgi:hypothetical protein